MQGYGEEEAPPPFARLGSQQAVTVSRSFEVSAWAGQKAKLVAVQKTLEDALEQAYKSAVADAGNNPAGGPYRRASALEGLRDGHALHVTVTGEDERWRRRGDLAAIFDEVDVRDIERIRMATVDNYYSKAKVDLVFRKVTRDSPGVTVELSGEDRNWVTGLNDELREQLSRDKCWWAFMRRWWFAVGVGFAAFIIVMTGLYTLIPRNSLSTSTSNSIFFLVVASTVALQLLLTFVLGRILPSMEVLEPGQSSLGGRRLATLTALAAFVLSSVVIPLVLSAVLT